MLTFLAQTSKGSGDITGPILIGVLILVILFLSWYAGRNEPPKKDKTPCPTQPSSPSS